jgi:hypothetical protein
MLRLWCCCMAFPVPRTCFGILIPQFAGKFYVVAPDYVGFGYSDALTASDSATRSTTLVRVQKSFCLVFSTSRGSVSMCRIMELLWATASPPSIPTQ